MAAQEHEQRIAMGLARRAYLYGVYRVVFGGGLDAEGVSGVFSQETAAALQGIEEDLGAKEFACLASKELTAIRISVVDCIRENIACVEKTMGRGRDERFAESLVDGHAMLFRVPSDSYVKPWESPYVGTKAMMFQESTLDVRRRYHEAGFKLTAERHFPDDHIGAIMDYEARMSSRVYEAYADGRDAEARALLASQRSMLEAHVFTWIDGFVEEVAKKDGSAIFAAFAFGMDAFCRFDAEFCRDLEADFVNEEDDASPIGQGDGLPLDEK